MDELEEVIVIDDDDDDDDIDDYRNARRRIGRRRRSRGRGRSRGRSRRRRTGSIARGRSRGFDDRGNAGPVVRHDTGGLSYGLLIEAGSQVLAAIQPLPAPPVATGEVAIDIGNLMLYQTALAQHAKKDEQIRTIGSLASKVLA